MVGHICLDYSRLEVYSKLSNIFKPTHLWVGWGENLKLNPASILVLGIAIYFLSAVIPGAISNFFGANTTGWDTGTVALWGLIPLAIIAVLVFVFVPKGGGKGA